jgi:hypothetical protein
VPDGLAPDGDRENSYAWSMDVLGDQLYVGSNRNVFSLAKGCALDIPASNER